MRKVLVLASVCILSSVLAACKDAAPTAPLLQANGIAAVRSTDADKLTLHPSGFGPHSYAAWKAKEGLQDDVGNGDHALYFQKDVPTTTVAAGVAVISGLEGTLFTEITGLSWDHRSDGHCGAGAPRWTVSVSQGEERGFIHIGCLAAAHTPAGTDDNGRLWIHDEYTNASIAAAIASGAASVTNPNIDPTAVMMIDALYIIFDEGNDVGPGFVHLDNITVEVNGVPQTFTGPADNGR